MDIETIIGVGTAAWLLLRRKKPAPAVVSDVPVDVVDVPPETPPDAPPPDVPLPRYVPDLRPALQPLPRYVPDLRPTPPPHVPPPRYLPDLRPALRPYGSSVVPTPPPQPGPFEFSVGPPAPLVVAPPSTPAPAPSRRDIEDAENRDRLRYIRDAASRLPALSVGPADVASATRIYTIGARLLDILYEHRPVSPCGNGFVATWNVADTVIEELNNRAYDLAYGPLCLPRGNVPLRGQRVIENAIRAAKLEDLLPICVSLPTGSSARDRLTVHFNPNNC